MRAYNDISVKSSATHNLGFLKLRSTRKIKHNGKTLHMLGFGSRMGIVGDWLTVLPINS